ncbi:peptidase [Liquorilactobacillus sucicola DSM 21376 = JCM 15457]|uniref:M16 family peptidase n=1 Tax=Liquorilactobacillus sucicola DSM 21376 = JCM 15457 TaxID=1423806 RepID=A0A023CVV8_9LACO|nr:pitrilysin family protein [Liquorilactobacillus sucicola]KRN06028.1 M16 family peptidase [Liquorilactobacillus sucicola DSM 21376 = JCM 15457]GAJ25954.1 peptidase [Liquorilactobacillus sucicola DSM 21376 = JCM 15457]
MEIVQYAQFGEKMYKEKLDNGLEVNILPKRGYHKTYGILTTDYGSLDNKFVPLHKTKMERVPDGVAHFLEHKLFEKKDHDAFELFGHYGADANAFTSFTNTSYLFSTASYPQKNLEILLNFVQEPYFNAQSVEKEKGIIGQEIKMYEDDIDWRFYFGMLKNLYPEHPLSVDIAGTTESISKITVENLYDCYWTFYHPRNMNLFVTGDVDPEETFELINKNQARKNFAPAEEVKRAILKYDESGQDIIPYRMLELDTQRAKAAVGVKGLDQVPAGRAGLTYKMRIEMLLWLLFSDTSANYTRLYNEGIIDDSFDFMFQLERGFHYASISSDTNDPQKFCHDIINILENAEQILKGHYQQFNLAKKELLGRQIHIMNSLEGIANQYSGHLFEGATVFDKAAVIQQMEFEDVLQACKAFIRSEAVSVYQILPKEGI